MRTKLNFVAKCNQNEVNELFCWNPLTLRTNYILCEGINFIFFEAVLWIFKSFREVDAY